MPGAARCRPCRLPAFAFASRFGKTGRHDDASAYTRIRTVLHCLFKVFRRQGKKGDIDGLCLGDVPHAGQAEDSRSRLVDGNHATPEAVLGHVIHDAAAEFRDILACADHRHGARIEDAGRVQPVRSSLVHQNILM